MQANPLVYKAVSDEYRIPRHRKNPSHYELQRKTHNYLEMRGWKVEGEVTAPCPDRRTHRKREKIPECRIDLVVYQQGEPIAVIEIKPRARQRPRGKKMQTYLHFGVPCLVVTPQTSLLAVSAFLRFSL